LKEEIKNYKESEAAKILGISRITLKRIRLGNEISYYRIGKARVFYGQQHLDEYMRKCERKVK
jgi:hypothetical protein